MRYVSKLILTLLLLTISVNANCSDNFDWTNLCAAICKIESNGNCNAVSKNGLYVGPLQMDTRMVKEANKCLGYKKYTLKDRYSMEKSIEIFAVIQKKYNPTNDIEKAIRIWNGGCNYSKAKTERFYKKVMKVYKKSQGN